MANFLLDSNVKSQQGKEIIYIGDPMCSWCYGFSEEIRSVRQEFEGRVAFRVVMGGLRPDGKHIVTDAYRAFLRRHWEEIEMRTSKQFSYRLLENSGWVYDTEKACRAVVTVRKIDHQMEWDYFAATQKGFYFSNHDPNSPDSFADLAEEFCIDRRKFLDTYLDPTTALSTARDFLLARQLGVNSFPTVLLRDDRGMTPLTVGYRSYEEMKTGLDHWVRDAE